MVVVEFFDAWGEFLAVACMEFEGVCLGVLKMWVFGENMLDLVSQSIKHIED